MAGPDAGPAARPGRRSPQPFPAPDAAPAPEVPTGPLHVVRYQPEGDVAIAPFVTITFDQPMVPLGTVGQVAAASVPATIEATTAGAPAIEGTWQWIGTRTLRFDATSDAIDRLPMATEYRVTVPSGTTAATGGVLADDVSFSFRTPPVTVQSLQPLSDSLPLTPLFVATFDQRVDPAAVLATVTFTADNDAGRHPIGDGRGSGRRRSRPAGHRAALPTAGGSRSSRSNRCRPTPRSPSASGRTPRRPRDR